MTFLAPVKYMLLLAVALGAAACQTNTGFLAQGSSNGADSTFMAAPLHLPQPDTVHHTIEIKEVRLARKKPHCRTVAHIPVVVGLPNLDAAMKVNDELERLLNDYARRKEATCLTNLDYRIHLETSRILSISQVWDEPTVPGKLPRKRQLQHNFDLRQGTQAGYADIFKENYEGLLLWLVKQRLEPAQAAALEHFDTTLPFYCHPDELVILWPDSSAQDGSRKMALSYQALQPILSDTGPLSTFILR